MNDAYGIHIGLVRDKQLRSIYTELLNYVGVNLV